MKFHFQLSDIDVLSLVFGTPSSIADDVWMWQMLNPESRQAQTIVIQNNVEYGEEKGSMAVVQTKHGYFELHRCAGYVPLEPDEVIFVSVRGEDVAGLVVGKECTCSMFAPISRSLLHADLADIDPSLLMSAMQLALSERILDDAPEAK